MTPEREIDASRTVWRGFDPATGAVMQPPVSLIRRTGASRSVPRLGFARLQTRVTAALPAVDHTPREKISGPWRLRAGLVV